MSMFRGSLTGEAGSENVAAMSARACIAAAIVVLVTTCFGFYCRHRIAGITGDTLGANVQLCESAALLTFLWAWSPR